jgi:hypothetical protein
MATNLLRAAITRFNITPQMNTTQFRRKCSACISIFMVSASLAPLAIAQDTSGPERFPPNRPGQITLERYTEILRSLSNDVLSIELTVKGCEKRKLTSPTSGLSKAAYDEWRQKNGAALDVIRRYSEIVDRAASSRKSSDLVISRSKRKAIEAEVAQLFSSDLESKKHCSLFTDVLNYTFDFERTERNALAVIRSVSESELREWVSRRQ